MKGLKKYLQNRENAITFLLAKPARSVTPLTFHKLRVEIKKLNALFELIEFCIKDFKRKKAFRPFKHIFHQAGKVREIQVEEALLKKYSIENPIIDYLKKLRIQRLKERRAFLTLINESLIALLEKSCFDILPLLTGIDEDQVINYLKKKRNKIKKHLNNCEFKPDQIHELRKLLKCYDYNRKIIGPGIQTTSSVTQAGFSDLLGKWHDCQVIGDHLEIAIAEGGTGTEAVNHLVRIKAIIESENELVLDSIRTGIAAFEFI